MSKFLEIDGAYGSGGGQILRTSIGFSAFTGKPCRIFNIRAGRKKPGLREQHLQAIRAVSTLCRGDLQGDEIGSSEITFTPHEIRTEDVSISISTAGSVGLVLQALMIASISRETCIRISGGATFAKWAVPALYLREVLAPMLAKMGVILKLTINREGFYPKGGAEIEAQISATPSNPLILNERKPIQSVRGISVAASSLQKAQVAERQAKTATDLLRTRLGITPSIDVMYSSTLNPGSGILLWADTGDYRIGASEVGERGKRAEDVGQSAGAQLVAENREGCVDSFAGDQLLPYIAISGGKIAVSKITDHCRTNAFVIERFLPVKFKFTDNVVAVENPFDLSP